MIKLQELMVSLWPSSNITGGWFELILSHSSKNSMNPICLKNV